SDLVVAQRMDQAQGFQRLAAAVDQVAAEPEPVAGGVEAELLQQPLGRAVAALQVTDRPDCHAPSMQRAWHGERERRDRCIEAGTVVTDHVVSALHGADRGGQGGTGGVDELLTRFQPRLLTDDAVAAYFL